MKSPKDKNKNKKKTAWLVLQFLVCNDFVFLLAMITRSPGSTTGTSRTKPARVMKKTTSLSFEMEMVFTTMSLKLGNYIYITMCVFLFFVFS